eukprot:comp16414_c1_seq1/m.14326 comp16414_c1_seq1/g.14326  ORF comp16414_c1_seq1/g.14326 comp16414_c1_seq1/m.14326 type:complete len:475 (-) comp16414_c1_seq1:502-1926(-)
MKCLLKEAVLLACVLLAHAQGLFPFVMTEFCMSSPYGYAFSTQNTTDADVTPPPIPIPMNKTSGKCLYPGRRDTNGQYANFGNMSSKHYLAIYAPPQNQSLGCAPLDRAPLWLEEYPNGFAVLLLRGNCTFVEKAQNAIRIGAKAVIFGNNPGLPMASPSSDSENLNLPITALIITWSEFDFLKKAASYRSYNATTSILAAEMVAPSVFHMLMPVLIPTVLGTMGAALGVLLGIYAYFKIRQLRWERAQRERALGEITRNKEAMRELKTKMYKKPTLDSNPDAPDETFCSGCAVCLEEFETGESVRELPCHHVFHTACIDPWLEKKATCPNCKYNIVSKRYEPINLKDGQPALVSTANSERVGGDADSTVTMETPIGMGDAGTGNVTDRTDPTEEESVIEVRSPTPKTESRRSEPIAEVNLRSSDSEIRSVDRIEIEIGSCGANSTTLPSTELTNETHESGFTVVEMSVAAQPR